MVVRQKVVVEDSPSLAGGGVPNRQRLDMNHHLDLDLTRPPTS